MHFAGCCEAQTQIDLAVALSTHRRWFAVALEVAAFQLVLIARKGLVLHLVLAAAVVSAQLVAVAVQTEELPRVPAVHPKGTSLPCPV